jgi:hypothetical protein
MKNRVITVILLIFCLILMVASPAMAAQKSAIKIDTGANYGGTSITVIAPESINLGVMTVGGATPGQSNPNGSITTDASTWTVTVADTTTTPGNKGYMTNTSTADQLHDKLQIGQVSGDLHNADSGFTYSGSGNTGDLPFFVSQYVTSQDVPGSYSITITFIGTYQ